MQSSSRVCAFSVVAGCFKSFLLVPVAHASAWTLEKDTGYQSLNVSYENGDFGKNWRQDSYIEYGLTSDWTVVSKVETVWRVLDNYNDRTSGEIGVRREVWVKDALHISAVSSVFVGERLDDQSCGGFGAEVGAALGYSSKLANKPAYAFVETAVGARQGCEHVTTDVVIGVQPAEKWDVQVKAFGEKFPGREFTKLEVGVSRQVGKSFVGAGVRKEISGAFEENSAFMSIWRKF